MKKRPDHVTHVVVVELDMHAVRWAGPPTAPNSDKYASNPLPLRGTSAESDMSRALADITEEYGCKCSSEPTIAQNIC